MFSYCKRKTYYSTLVDDYTSKQLEVIFSRNQPDVVEMLKRFPRVKTFTRDFSKTYKVSIEESHPNAKQIVDRFHILKNLTNDTIDYLKRKIGEKIKILDSSKLTRKKRIKCL